jgi:hypothetical protein
MRLGRNLVLGVMVLILAAGVGCKKRKPQIPAQVTPPKINQPSVPPVASQPLPTPPTVTNEPPQPGNTVPSTSTAKKTRIRRKKSVAPVTSATADTTPAPKTGTPGTHKSGSDSTPGDTNVQISAEVPQPAANLRRQQTESLLQAAEWNLKRVNRTLTDGEESMQHQVRNFITQSRLALTDGDVERAYNLATKASLLSQELVK